EQPRRRSSRRPWRGFDVSSFTGVQARDALEAPERLADLLDRAHRGIAGLRERGDLGLDALSLALKMIAQLGELGDQAVDLGDGAAGDALDEVGDVGPDGLGLTLGLLTRLVAISRRTRGLLPHIGADVAFDLGDLARGKGSTIAHGVAPAL